MRQRIVDPERKPPTWDQYKSAVRKADRESTLVGAAGISAVLANGGGTDNLTEIGLTHWAVGDVARMALAWSRWERPKMEQQRFAHLCSMYSNIAEGSLKPGPHLQEHFERSLMRLLQQQLPHQRSALQEIARSLLLFGSSAEYPAGYTPQSTTPQWFERLTGGLTLEQYLESIFVISAGARQNGGLFSLAWLDGPAFAGLEETLSFWALRKTFDEHLVTNSDDFKAANREFQDGLPTAQRKFAFNPLRNKPFIDDVAPIPIAPWVQVIIAKCYPPSIYHMALPALGDRFANDLGAVFQHYTGRQLRQMEGSARAIPEVPYGPKAKRRDSVDWFLDLPDMVVLIECKARQPVEAGRLANDSWMTTVQSSLARGIEQLNTSNTDLDAISAAGARLDLTKPRVGLVVTLEPFYARQNPLLRSYLPDADFPVGIISIEELEALVTLNSDELNESLRIDSQTGPDHVMYLNTTLDAALGRTNALLDKTFDQIDLFGRLDKAKTMLASEEPNPG